MDKKKLIRPQSSEDLKGFEEFIDGQPIDASFLSKGNALKNEVSFEHFTFLTNDANRLLKIKNLLMDKIPFAMKYEQGNKLLSDQKNELKVLKKNLIETCNKPDSAYLKSVREIFDSFFSPPTN